MPPQIFEEFKVQVYGFDGTEIRRIKTDADGVLQVAVLSMVGDFATETTLNNFYTAWLSISPYYSLQYNLLGNMYTSINNIASNTTNLNNALNQDNSALTATYDLMIGGLVNGGGYVAGRAGQFNINTKGALRAVPSDGSSDAPIIKESTGNISGVNGFPAWAFKSSTGTAIAPALTAAGLIKISLDAITAAINVATITTSIVPGTSATHLGKAVSSAKGATDTGVQMLAIRDDTLGIFSDAEGDYEPLHITSTGRLWASVLIDTEIPAGTQNIGDVDVLTLPVGQAAMAASTPVVIASDQTPVNVNTSYFQQDTFTGTGAGTTVNATAMPVTYFGVLVKGTGAAATAWTLAVQWSLDGTNWTDTPLTHGTADGDGANKSGYSLLTGIRPARYFRVNVTALTLGGATNIVVSVVGMRI